MNCQACGYTYLEDYQKEDLIRDNHPLPEKLGNKQFLRSENKFVFEDPSNSGFYTSYGWNNGTFQSYLYMCPECGTLKAEKW